MKIKSGVVAIVFLYIGVIAAFQNCTGEPLKKEPFEGLGSQQLTGMIPKSFLSASNERIKSIDLQQYFPKQYKEFRYRRADGYVTGAFRFYEVSGQELEGWYLAKGNLNNQGRTFVKEQLYNFTSSFDIPINQMCRVEYDFWRFGSDLSIVEAASYSDHTRGGGSATGNCVSKPGDGGGYVKLSDQTPSGLFYSGPGGLTTDGFQQFDLTNSLPGASPVYPVFSYSRLEAFYPSWSPAYGLNDKGEWTKGAGKVFKNVALITFWHGVKDVLDLEGHPGCLGVRSDDRGLDPANPRAAYYVRIPGYETYASQFYLAPDVGIIQAEMLYMESKKWANGAYDCSGGIMGKSFQKAQDIYTNYGEF